MAAFLAVVTGASLVRAGLVLGILEPARARMRASGIDPAAVPFTEGLTLAAVYLDGAAWLTWPAGLAAVARVVFTEPRTFDVQLEAGPLRRALAAARRWPDLAGIAVAWALGSVVLAWAYPSTAVRGAGLVKLYLAVQLVALLVAVAALGSWVWRRERPTTPRACVLLVIGTEAANLAAGGWARGALGSWSLAQVQLVGLYTIITALEIVAWRSSSPSKPS